MKSSLEDIRKYLERSANVTPFNDEEITICINRLHYLVSSCEKWLLPIPNIDILRSGDGVYASWVSDKYHIEIAISRFGGGADGFFVISGNYDDSISCKFDTVNDAFKMVKVFLKNLVNT